MFLKKIQTRLQISLQIHKRGKNTRLGNSVEFSYDKVFLKSNV